MMMKHFSELLTMWAVNMFAFLYCYTPAFSFAGDTIQAAVIDTTPWTQHVTSWLVTVSTIITTIYGIIQLVKKRKPTQTQTQRVDQLLKELEEFKKKNTTK